MAQMYKGLGNQKDYQHSLDFLNEVFFADEEKPLDFLSLLPKLYKKEYNHCENNLIVSVNGEWKGAVGLYFDETEVMGNKLLCGGIGNVAVGKDCRGEGYMQQCMQMSMNKMIEKDADFSVLGGQRQRYGYFSFAPAGYSMNFIFNISNLKHIYGSCYSSELVCSEVFSSDCKSLDFIKRLYASKPERFIRPDDRYFDYLTSWKQRVFIFKDGNNPVGYCVFDEFLNKVVEIKAISTDYFKKLIPAAYFASGKEQIYISLPMYEQEYVDYLSQTAESQSIENCCSLCVLNWKKFIKAYMELKASYTPLCDGRASFLIHGYKQDEAFTIEIKNGCVTVSDQVNDPLELTQHEATALFFSTFSEKKYKLSPEVAQWLPLHWFIHSADKV